MARIRTVKPEFWTDETLAELPRDVRLLFLGLLNHVDDEGRCVDNEKLVKAAVFPLDDDVDSTTVRRWLDELSSTRRVVLYEVAGRRYLQVANFKKHQKIDRPKDSILPSPQDGRIVHVPAGQRTFDEPSTNDRRTVVDASLLDQGKDQGTGIREQGMKPAVELSSNTLPAIIETTAVADAPAARTRNAAFDALCHACLMNPDEMTDPDRRATGVALAAIRKVWPGTDDDLIAELPRRAAAYMVVMPHATLTPSALAKNWSRCTERNMAAADPSARKAFGRAVNGGSEEARKARILAKVEAGRR